MWVHRQIETAAAPRTGLEHEWGIGMAVKTPDWCHQPKDTQGNLQSELSLSFVDHSFLQYVHSVQAYRSDIFWQGKILKKAQWWGRGEDDMREWENLQTQEEDRLRKRLWAKVVIQWPSGSRRAQTYPGSCDRRVYDSMRRKGLPESRRVCVHPMATGSQVLMVKKQQGAGEAWKGKEVFQLMQSCHKWGNKHECKGPNTWPLIHCLPRT